MEEGWFPGCGQLSRTEPRQAVVTLRCSQVRGRLGGTAVAGTLGGKDGLVGMAGVQEMWSQIWRWEEDWIVSGKETCHEDTSFQAAFPNPGSRYSFALRLDALKRSVKY